MRNITIPYFNPTPFKGRFPNPYSPVKLYEARAIVAEDERSVANSRLAKCDVLAQLKSFCQAAYKRLSKAHDATFKLTDAVLPNTI